MRYRIRAVAIALPICVAVGLAAYQLGRTTAAPLPQPAPVLSVAQSADLEGELASMRAALELSEQRNVELQEALQERTSAMWELVAEYWRHQDAPPPQTSVDLDHEWQTAMTAIGGGLFHPGENPQPWLFYDSFMDGLAHIVEFGRQGEAAVRYLESVVNRPLPVQEPEQQADEEVDGTGDSQAIEPASETGDEEEVTEDDEDDQDVDEEQNEAQRLRKEREAAIEFLSEFANPSALDSLLRLRDAYPEDPDLRLNVIRQHVELMPVAQIEPYLNRILTHCRDTLNAGIDDNQLVAVTAYLAFRHNVPGAMTLLRSPTLLDRDCVNGANIASDVHTEAAHVYVRWLATSSRDSATVETATAQLQRWDN